MAHKVWQNWDWMVEAFEDLGFSARIVTLPLDQLYVIVDLGEGWFARFTTHSGNLTNYSPSYDPLSVSICASETGFPSGDYRIDWSPPSENVRHAPRAVAPLLHRLSRPPRASVPPPRGGDDRAA